VYFRFFIKWKTEKLKIYLVRLLADENEAMCRGFKPEKIKKNFKLYY